MTSRKESPRIINLFGNISVFYIIRKKIIKLEIRRLDLPLLLFQWIANQTGLEISRASFVAWSETTLVHIGIGGKAGFRYYVSFAHNIKFLSPIIYHAHYDVPTRRP